MLSSLGRWSKPALPGQLSGNADHGMCPTGVCEQKATIIQLSCPLMLRPAPFPAGNMNGMRQKEHLILKWHASSKQLPSHACDLSPSCR